ncbi:MAG: UDP-N-acetylmuramate dehydrogenase [Desulfobacterales bacterium]|jgi:UDP-N-acetylmuramate dehydrogenase
MAIVPNMDLKPFNTFGVAASARYFASIARSDDLLGVLADPNLAEMPKVILGGGSNLLFTRDFDGLVLKNDIRGIQVLKEDRQSAWVRAGAGEDWDAFVRWTLTHRFYGLENLALIPGSVGASPVQNIGAYGVEVGPLIDRVEAIELASGARRRFHGAECAWGYRTSIFKAPARDRYFITAVTFRLAKSASPVTTYADVAQAIAQGGEAPVTPEALSDIIRSIRRRKLPDPAQLGNAGSFFKNPVVTAPQLSALLAAHPTMPHYPLAGGRAKIAAGWLIEQCGWKGKRAGACGVYPRQALVLVNYGGARGKEILDLARSIRASVQATFGLDLEPEPRIL